MAYRNSLRGCIRAMGSLYNNWQQKELFIVHMPRGKYYSVLTPGEFNNLADTAETAGARPIFHGTLRELKEFVFPPEPQLILDSVDLVNIAEAPSTDAEAEIEIEAGEFTLPADHPDREFPGSDAPEELPPPPQS